MVGEPEPLEPDVLRGLAVLQHLGGAELFAREEVTEVRHRGVLPERTSRQPEARVGRGVTFARIREVRSGHHGTMTEPTAVIDELFRRQRVGDLSVLDDVVADDMVNHAAGPQGREGLRQILEAIRHDFGDGDLQQHHLLADGDLVVQHLTFTGVHQASSMPLLEGTAPTGVDVSWTFIHIWRVEDGWIVEHWATRDDLGLLHQIGAWPPAPLVAAAVGGGGAVMRTLHFGLRVADLERSLAFYTAVGYEVVGSVPDTPLGTLTMIKLPGDEFVAIELVHDPDAAVADTSRGPNHFVIQVESMDATVARLAAGGVDAEAPSSPDGSDDFFTSWIVDPDGNRIELVQWPPATPTA